MKIIVFDMHDSYGGVEAYLWSTISRLQSQNHLFDFITKLAPMCCKHQSI